MRIRSAALLAPALLLLVLGLPGLALAQTLTVPQGPQPASAVAQTAPQTAPKTPPSQTHQAGAATGKATTPPAAQGKDTTGSSAATTAQSGPAYDIEIVIFRAKVNLGQPEHWNAEQAEQAIVAGGEAASGSGATGKLLAVLPSSADRLTDIVSKLRSSSDYAPVAHVAWEQTASAWGTHSGLPLQTLGINVPGLTGEVILERGQYLHLGMRLDYTLQAPPPGLDAAPGTTFVMNQTRRVRLYQRNYFDHPAFGVIALVTPARGNRQPGR